MLLLEGILQHSEDNAAKHIHIRTPCTHASQLFSPYTVNSCSSDQGHISKHQHQQRRCPNMGHKTISLYRKTVLAWEGSVVHSKFCLP